MSLENRLKKLTWLKSLQKTKLTKLEGELAILNRQKESHVNNLQRLQSMFDTTAISNSACLLELNRTDYRQQLLNMIKLQEWELSLQESKITAGREKIWQSALTLKKWDSAYGKSEKLYCKVKKSKEQKQQDELAGQVGFRRSRF
ncbi:hypothetical protein [Chromobacterium amazonense]|uniref:hypothetical protein n=1 Tax=Chromobacterium amazonense TaxID=1382803 RepID=UPI0031F6CBF7